ncbi:uncharacterized protein IWZ02DRAFT_429563 [Phyllosticta citriasiana]|uniref:Secreted protein n=1 Tax=Phyllosticta citriasiana TaxID=595635 RepID=A0ABR1KCV5_9PEZI
MSLFRLLLHRSRPLCAASASGVSTNTPQEATNTARDLARFSHRLAHRYLRHVLPPFCIDVVWDRLRVKLADPRVEPIWRTPAIWCLQLRDQLEEEGDEEEDEE